MTRPRYHLTQAEHLEVRDRFLQALEAHAGIVTAGLEPDRALAVRMALADEAYRWAARILVGEDAFPPSPEARPRTPSSPPPIGPVDVGALLMALPPNKSGCAGCGAAIDPKSNHYSSVPGRGDLCLPCWSATIGKALL